MRQRKFELGFFFSIIYLQEIMERLKFFRCLFVCPSLNKIPAEWMHQLWCGFCQMVAYCTGLDLIEIGDLGLKVKVICTSDHKHDSKRRKKLLKIQMWILMKSKHVIGCNFSLPTLWYHIWLYRSINKTSNYLFQKVKI